MERRSVQRAVWPGRQLACVPRTASDCLTARTRGHHDATISFAGGPHRILGCLRTELPPKIDSSRLSADDSLGLSGGSLLCCYTPGRCISRCVRPWTWCSMMPSPASPRGASPKTAAKRPAATRSATTPGMRARRLLRCCARVHDEIGTPRQNLRMYICIYKYMHTYIYIYIY